MKTDSLPNLPGDKSISHRAVLLSVLAQEPVLIHGLNTGADVTSSLTCIQALGARVESLGCGSIRIHPPSSRTHLKPVILDCGNSGTTMRLLSGLLAHFQGNFQLIGDASLSKRPMGRVLKPLGQMGLYPESTSHQTQAPLKLQPQKQPKKDFQIRLEVASAQVKSALLLAGMARTGQTSLTEPAFSRDHTERLLQWLNLPLHVQGLSLKLDGPVRHLPGWEQTIPRDPSSALHLGLLAFLPTKILKPICLKQVACQPARSLAFEVLKNAGADLMTLNHQNLGPEPVWDCIFSPKGRIRGFQIEKQMVPALIDEIPMLAAVAAHAEGISRFEDIGELRHKEADRLKLCVQNLQKFGARVKAGEDWMEIEGKPRLQSTLTIPEVCHDHRLAMVFGLLYALYNRDFSLLEDPSISVSFPDFFASVKEVLPC